IFISRADIGIGKILYPRELSLIPRSTTGDCADIGIGKILYPRELSLIPRSTTGDCADIGIGKILYPRDKIFYGKMEKALAWTNNNILTLKQIEITNRLDLLINRLI
ncbi:hypothetical protein ACJX0J_019791, partial [Zea mays]